MNDGDAEAQVFAQKRAWFHVHVAALIGAVGSGILAAWLFEGFTTMTGLCVVLAGIAGLIGGRTMLYSDHHQDEFALDRDPGVDGVEVTSYERFFLVVMTLGGAALTVYSVLRLTGLLGPP